MKRASEVFQVSKTMRSTVTLKPWRDIFYAHIDEWLFLSEGKLNYLKEKFKQVARSKVAWIFNRNFPTKEFRMRFYLIERLSRKIIWIETMTFNIGQLWIEIVGWDRPHSEKIHQEKDQHSLQILRQKIGPHMCSSFLFS